ncbi:pilus assembly FimT family protein [Pseudomonas benzenivorans]|uniref:Prepilin-type N-terminal cleavage/methylation domain-containing protein n=1 Tax=Pseudomonas benzenivorans TaxID=556533 RepID=A0ABY5H748_9PSED|nr:prepilin-type N-terminal cleavage/methylation domain-containing protein [Pseudomonas benzenivorans]UTW07130.1 prepilin-type N-terminal cleavage/methylation domain-containing protein [Pseudomonas benzenivorans]
MRGVAAGRGLSLVELLAVVAILGGLALVALPGLSAGDPEKLDRAAAEVAAAIRFARAEAQRTGIEHGVELNPGTQQLRLYRLDTGGGPTAVYDVRHPLDKRFYQLSFGSAPLLGGVRLQSAQFLYQGSATARSLVGFIAGGQPSHNDAGTQRLLSSGTAVLSYRGRQRTLLVTPLSGRVTVQ